MNDARMSYELGYAPPEKNWNGKFHKLRVTSKTKGIRIQAKNGYYAWPQSKTQQAIAAIRPVAADPVDASEIGMRGAIASLSANNSRVNVDIDRKDVVTIDEGGSHKTSLTAAVLTYGAPGTGLTAIPSLIPIDARRRHRPPSTSAGTFPSIPPSPPFASSFTTGTVKKSAP